MMLAVLLTMSLIPCAALLVSLWGYPANWLVRALFTSLACIHVFLVLDQLRFALPIRWRRNATWDRFLCSIGSHRCRDVCGRGCCWECIRCKSDKEAHQATENPARIKWRRIT